MRDMPRRPVADRGVSHGRADRGAPRRAGAAVPAAASPAAAPAVRGADAAALALGATLAALLAARAALTFVPSMGFWSLNLQRFLAPAWGWGLWGLAALAFAPPVTRRAHAALDRAGAFAARRPGWTAALAGLVAAALVWLLPDRVRLVGDFLVRQGTVEQGDAPSVLFPQALPLDVFLHYQVPLMAKAAGATDPALVPRLLGGLEAAGLAAIALGFAAVLELRGAARIAVATAVLCGAWLGLWTGYSKAFGEMVLVVAGTGLAAVAALRGGRGLVWLGILPALGLTLHRSALGLLPGAGLAFGLALAKRGGWRALARPAALAALAIVALALALLLPRIAGDIRHWDVVHFTPAEVQAEGGPLRAALADHRPLDLLNLLVLLSPLALPALAAGVALGPRMPRISELLTLKLLALPFVVATVFIHPTQGLFRDWDDFAAAGMALTLPAAWVAALALPATRRAWVCVAATVTLAVFSVQWLAHHDDRDRGLARVHAFLAEAPTRTPAERARLWDFLGVTSYRRERWTEAADAFSRSAETGPSLRILSEWAEAEIHIGDLRAAQGLMRRAVTDDPRATAGWLRLAEVSARLAEEDGGGPERAADIAEARRAATIVLDASPGEPQATSILQFLDTLERRPAGSARP